MATHPCPAGCGRRVSNDMYACKRDWFRLPHELRWRIKATYLNDPDAHYTAMREAERWYADNDG